jgi:hypothetical protein
MYFNVFFFFLLTCTKAAEMSSIMKRSDPEIPEITASSGFNIPSMNISGHLSSAKHGTGHWVSALSGLATCGQETQADSTPSVAVLPTWLLC